MNDDQEQSIIQLLAEESDRLAESPFVPPVHPLPPNSGLCAWDQDSCSSQSFDEEDDREGGRTWVETRSQPEIEEKGEWEDWGKVHLDQSLRIHIKPISSSASHLKPETHKRLLESVVSGGALEAPKGKPHALRLFKSNALSEKPQHPLKPGRTLLEPGKIRRRSDAYEESQSVMGSRSPLPQPQDRFW